MDSPPSFEGEAGSGYENNISQPGQQRHLGRYGGSEIDKHIQRETL